MGDDLGGSPFSSENSSVDGEIIPCLNFDPKLPVLIIGAGTAGLTLAQGLQEAGVPFEIYEEGRTTRKTAIPEVLNEHVHYATSLEGFQMRCGSVDIVEATFSDDTKVTGSILVGADGSWSTVRLLLLGEEESDNALNGWITYNGRVTLIGDAAHPVAMEGSEKSIHASRDGKMLAQCLVCAWGRAGLEEAVREYEGEMRERTLLSVVMNSPKVKEALEVEEAQKEDDDEGRLGRQDSGVIVDSGVGRRVEMELIGELSDEILAA